MSCECREVVRVPFDDRSRRRCKSGQSVGRGYVVFFLIFGLEMKKREEVDQEIKRRGAGWAEWRATRERDHPLEECSLPNVSLSLKHTGSVA